MTKTITSITLSLFLTFCLCAQQTPDTVSQDPFAWLEDVESTATKDWIKKQKREFENFITPIRRRQKGLSNVHSFRYIEFDFAIREGQHYYKKYYTEPGRPPALFFKKKFTHNEEPLIEPFDIDRFDRIAITNYEEDPSGKYLAVAFNRNGSDWREIKVKKMRSAGWTKDHIKNVKFSSLDWDNHEGFFYLSYPKSDRFAAESTPSLMYHKLGTEQTEDRKVYHRKSDKLVEVSFSILPSRELLILREKIDSKWTNYYYLDLRKQDFIIRPLLPRINKFIDVIDNRGDTLFFITNHPAAENVVAQMTLEDPTNWTIFIDDTPKEKRLNSCSRLGDYLACWEKGFQQTTIKFYDHVTGHRVQAIDFEQGYSSAGFYGGKDDKETYFYFSNYFTPPIAYRLDLETFEQELVKKVGATYKIDDFHVSYTTYPASDSTAIPMTLVYKGNLRKNAKRPTLLKTYGGFGITHSPSFDPGLIYFLEEGGLFAYAHVRGEGTLGKEWQKAGQGVNKPTAINDFINAAEFLIDQKYTSNDHLGITGASHGGMMVGAAMVQRPDLFKAAVPIVGLFDMIKAEDYTIGVFHEDEFADADSEEGFQLLMSYSPYHNLRDDVNYPSCLIMTNNNDDRVPPFHSYKFAAKLMNNPAQQNPVILRSKRQTGHYGSNTYRGDLEESADMYAFLLEMLKQEN